MSFETNAAVVYVDIDKAPGGDGTSWSMAFDNINDAISAANNGDEIWIAEGIYEESILVYKDINLYGGFQGFETTSSSRDVVYVKTEIQYFGTGSAIFITNSDVIMDGIHFSGSMKNLIDATSSSPFSNYQLSNCFITGTYEREGLSFHNVNDLEIFNCVFYNIYIESGSDGFSTLFFLSSGDYKIVNNTFINNENICFTLYFTNDLGSIDVSNNILQDENEHHICINYIASGPTDFTYKGNVLKNKNIVSGYGCDASNVINTSLELGDDNIIHQYIDDDFIPAGTSDFIFIPEQCSPFVNAGSNDQVISSNDVSENNRIVGEVVDAGAFENLTTLSKLYVDKNATGANDGTSWTDAHTNLQEAADMATCGTEIWVAEGIYRIDDQGVRLKNNVKLYGGFNGTQGELTQRDWNLYKTTLSGNFDLTPNTSDDTPSLIILDGSAITTVTIDGFTMQKTDELLGIQAVIQSSSLKADLNINNVIFKNNRNELIQHSGNTYLSNVLVDDNVGELFLTYSGGDFVATNCTFVNNSKTILSATSASIVDFKNCIFWNNENPDINANGADYISFTNNNYDTISIDAPGIDSSSIYHYDPLFVDESNSDYTLGECSPLIDLGVADFDAPTYDLARSERESNGQIDIGAYEYQYLSGHVIYVDLTATGGNDGSSWNNAFTDLQDAIAIATQGEEIWVAQGTYYPYELSSPDPADRFLLDCGVSMYGGFLGNETSLEERNIAEHETILSGRDINSGNLFSYHILRLKDFTADAVVDGFTIEGGFASNASITHGAGIWMSNSLGTVNNCIIKNCIAERGGGIAIINSPKGNIRNCEITNNEAEIEGGGIYVKNSTLISRNNIYALNVSLSGEAGGILFEGSTATLINNRFNNNVALTGGAMKSINSQVDINYSTFTTNVAIITASGGVLEIDNDSEITINNTIIYGNEASNMLNNFSGSTGSLELNNSIVEGNWSGSGSNIIDEDPLLEDYVPMSCSPALDIGLLENVPNNDITIKTRIQGNGPDLGAYENRNPYYINGQAGPDLSLIHI